MRKLIIILAVLMLASCAEPEFVAIEATVDSFATEYGATDIYYTISNIGTAYVNYYEVYFKLTDSQGNVFREWDNGSDLAVGRSKADWTITGTGDYPIVKVEVYDYNAMTY